MSEPQPTEEPKDEPKSEQQGEKKRVLRCACGSKRLEKTPSYGFVGWVLLLFGATPEPDGVAYHCTRCGKTVDADDLDD